MHEHHYRKVVSILEQRHRRRYVWLAHIALFAVAILIFHFSVQPVVYFWLGLLVLHLVYVIAKDVRGRMLRRQIEARYGWDRLDDDDIVMKRKPLYLEDNGELIEFEEPADEKLKRSY